MRGWWRRGDQELKKRGRYWRVNGIGDEFSTLKSAVDAVGDWSATEELGELLHG
jgi:hypothetical protein